MWLLHSLKKTATSISKTVISLFLEIRWGGWSLIALYLSLISGIVVGLQYDYSTPFFSAVSIELLVPYGSFFRSLHFYSSQFFFFFCCIHFVLTYSQGKLLSYRQWAYLLTSLPIIILLLFTGYVLRGDNTGTSAGLIAENIVLSIPLLGDTMNDFLFSISEDGLRKVYIHHIISFDLLLLVMIWQHLHRYKIRISDHLPVTIVMLLFSFLIAAPLEPETLGATYISGPWFFLGLQELLRYLPSFLAGVLIPCLFLVLLYMIHPEFQRSKLKIAILIWLIFYTLLSTVAWFR